LILLWNLALYALALPTPSLTFFLAAAETSRAGGSKGAARRASGGVRAGGASGALMI
jgi:hypothetical protein